MGQPEMRTVDWRRVGRGGGTLGAPAVATSEYKDCPTKIAVREISLLEMVVRLSWGVA